MSKKSTLEKCLRDCTDAAATSLVVDNARSLIKSRMSLSTWEEERVAMITCEPRSNGNVEIIGSGPLNASEASLLIAEIARAVTLAQEAVGRCPARQTQTPPKSRVSK